MVFELSARHGGRLSTLRPGEFELLGQPEPDVDRADPMSWGAYPMVPWAGRVANGTFEFEGHHVELPANLGPHALHGTAFTESWETVTSNRLRHDLGTPWPFGGSVEHRAHLTDSGLRLELEVSAGDHAMPAMVGWHPWFLRRLDPSIAEAELRVEMDSMFELDDAEIPTGKLVRPPAGPWDNCFLVRSDPVLVWPDHLELTLSSSCEYWVIFDRMDHALCVEPQSGPPNQFSMSAPFHPPVLQPRQSLTHHFDISWRHL